MEDCSIDNWKQIQTKTFTKWVNSKLKKAGHPQITSIFTDLSSGIVLVNLLASLDKPIHNYNKTPHSRIQKMENLNIILDFIRSQNIALVNIGPEDIVDGDQKLILGLIWTLISKMAISIESNSKEFLSMREEVLSWAQRVTKCYSHVKIKNLTTDWQNGIYFNAIVHRFRPELVPYFYALKETDSLMNCTQVFKTAEEELEIPRLFDPEDIIDVIKPDEKSILTYLSQFYEKFSNEELQVKSKEKLTTFFKGVNFSIESINTYEKQARAFLQKKKAFEDKTEEIRGSLLSITNEINQLEISNNELITESASLGRVFDNIRDVNNAFNLKEYQPPADLAISNVDMEYLNTDELFDLSEIKLSLEQFGSKDAKEVNRIKCVLRNIFTSKSTEEDVQSFLNYKFEELALVSKNKTKAYKAMKEMYDEKSKKLDMFVELEANSKSQLIKARELFNCKDTKKSGQISFPDFLKILISLELDTTNITKTSETVPLDVLLEEVEKLSSYYLTKEQIKSSMEGMSSDMSIDIYEIFPSVIPKGLKSIIKNNDRITYEELTKLFK